MKVLLDENVPETLAPAFDCFETLHVNQLGWQGKENGALLLAAREAGFTALVMVVRVVRADVRYSYSGLFYC